MEIVGEGGRGRGKGGEGKSGGEGEEESEGREGGRREGREWRIYKTIRRQYHFILALNLA